MNNYDNSGGGAPLYMVAYFLASGSFLRLISPPFGKYTAQEQKLEGDFRFTHSRYFYYAHVHLVMSTPVESFHIQKKLHSTAVERGKRLLLTPHSSELCSICGK